MAIAEMSTMTVVLAAADKEKLLDALQKTGAAQLKKTRELESLAFSEEDDGAVSAELDRTEKALAFLIDILADEAKKKGVAIEKDGFGVTREEFFAMGGRAEEMRGVMNAADEISSALTALKNEEGKISGTIRAYSAYDSLKGKFSDYRDTAFASVRLGILPFDKAARAAELLSSIEGCSFETIGQSGNGAVFVSVCHKEDAATLDASLSEVGFNRCPFEGDFTAGEKLYSLYDEIKELKKQTEEKKAELCAFAPSVKDLKLYADYLAFLQEKRVAANGFGKTEKTIVAEGWVPTEAAENVEKEIMAACPGAYAEFTPVPRDEFAPTLMKNKKVTRNFEAVTNMYSPPAYGALDPNGVMAFFFSLFMGLIMADVGYGVLMIVGGFLFAAKQRDGATVQRLSRVFAYGGFFAIAFGVLFDSWLGFAVLRNTLGEGYNAFYMQYLDAVEAPATIAGINIPAILLWCLGLGTVQIAVSLIMKAVQHFGRGEIAEGIFGGLVWAFALFAFVFWVFCLATGNSLAMPMAYVTGGLAVLGILTAGVGAKGFGKIGKSFMSIYGLLNYMSDILSYARLYGLMLSGAQIASIFSTTLAVGMLFPKGVGGVIAGVVVIVAANLFNLAMSLLSAFIHDSRLQYVEFFGRFYESEGELFTPLGRAFEHSYFKAE